MTQSFASLPQVRKKLRDVRCVTGSSRAFAALKEDGSVLAWGDADHGGDVGHARQGPGLVTGERKGDRRGGKGMGFLFG